MMVHRRTPLKVLFYLRLSDVILRGSRAMIRLGFAGAARTSSARRGR